jgi:hypothetical protein
LKKEKVEKSCREKLATTDYSGLREIINQRDKD